MARKADPGKRKAIIEGATQVFSRNGYARTRMAEVARTAGVGKGTIYEYFRSKEALFYATFKPFIIESEALVQAPLRDADRTAAECLKVIANELLQAWMAKMDLYGLMMEFWSATTVLPSRQRFKDTFQNAYTDFRRSLAAVIQRGIDSGEFEPANTANLASALIGSWDALLFQAWLDPEFDPLGASQTHLQVVLNGLSNPAFKERT